MQSSAHVQSALMHKLTLQSATRISDTGPTASGFPSKAQALLPLTLQVIHAITNQEPFELGKDAQKEITCWQSKTQLKKMKCKFLWSASFQAVLTRPDARFHTHCSAGSSVLQANALLTKTCAITQKHLTI